MRLPAGSVRSMTRDNGTDCDMCSTSEKRTSESSLPGKNLLLIRENLFLVGDDLVEGRLVFQDALLIGKDRRLVVQQLVELALIRLDLRLIGQDLRLIVEDALLIRKDVLFCH